MLFAAVAGRAMFVKLSILEGNELIPEPWSEASRLNHVMLGPRVICLIVLAELVVACGSQRPGAGPSASLVTGTVAAGPVSPVARPGVPSTRPVRGATVDALRGDKIVAVAHTDDVGRYQLRLQPGTYVITVKADQYLSKKAGQTVTISAGETLTADFVLDTGIR
jgi:hypothetical protein